MRFTALALLAATIHALTPSRKIKVARKNTLDSSVTFDEYQNIMDQCIVNSDSESAIEDCLKLTKQFEIVDVPPLDSKMAANRAQAQLETLAS